MAVVGGMPLVERQVRLAAKAGLRRIFMLTGHLSEVMERHFGDGSRFGAEIRFVREKSPLGSGGCLKQLEGLVDGRFLVFNGDLFMDFDVQRFLQADMESGQCAAHILVHPNSHPHDSDIVEEENGCVKALHLKPHPPGKDLPNLVNAGVFVFSPEALRHIAPSENLVLEKKLLPRILASGGKISVYRTSEYIKDIGTPERMSAAEEDARRGVPQSRRLDKPQRAVFLDRDGVVNRYVPDLRKAEDFELLSGAADAIRSINKSGYLAVLVTNQPVLAKGFMGFDELRAVHNRMESLLGAEGAYLDDIFFCPHHPERGFPGEVPELKIECTCRKPRPGMLLAAAAKYNISLGESFMIGDDERDMEAGRAAGCGTVYIGEATADGDIRAESLPEALKLVLE